MTSDTGVFGERLRAFRVAAGLSQEELAGRSGVSVRAIGDIERGRTRWPHRDSAHRLADALGLAGQEQEGFLALARRPADGSAAEPEPVTVPYRGLNAFGEQDAGLFFGREQAADRVLELMSARLDGAGLVVVSGVSGAGKSSLLRAGVLPRLRHAGLAGAPEAASWPCLVLTPGADPLAELAVRIAPLARTDAAALRQQLAECPAGFALTARQVALAAQAGPSSASPREGGQRRVVLVVDQCEQLFTACQSPQERQAFLAALHAAATGDGTGQCPAALVVLVVRADFEGRLADDPQLSAAVQDRYLLTAMTRRQLRLAITRPAAIAGSGVEEDLVQVLLEEVPARAGGPMAGGAAGAGRLPLLSHALDQAWRTRAGQMLTLADYERAGGIEGALAASAHRAYQGLTPAQQQVAQQVFTRLTAAGADGTDTAIPAARTEMTAGADSALAREVEAVLERFAAERLLTLDAGTVQISHEVLLAAWPLLRDDWLAGARADRVTCTRLHATAAEWAQASRDPSYLYSGSRLEAAAAAAARIQADPRQIPLSQAGKDFLHASGRAMRRGARTRRQLTAVLLALVAALGTAWGVAVRAGQVASTQRDIAVSRLLISQSEATNGADATASRLEAIAAWTVSPSPQARYALLTAAADPQTATITAGTDGGLTTALSPDGKILATGGPDGAQLWDTATGRPIGKPVNAGVVDWVTFRPDGRTLVTYGYGAQRWDVATGQQTGQATSVPDGPGDTRAVAFSPDGKSVAIGSPSGVRLWDITVGLPTSTFLAVPGGSNSEAVFSPDGKLLATGTDSGRVQVWDVATGQQAGRPFTAGGIGSMAFSPDGRMLATGTDSGRVEVRDVATGQQIGRPFTVSAAVSAVAFSPGGKILAAAGGGDITLWDMTAGQQIGTQLADSANGPIYFMAFSPDGATLATGSTGGLVRLWDMAAMSFRQLGSPAGISDAIFQQVAFSPDGKTLATSGPASAARLWDVATGQQTGQAGRSLAAGLSDAQAVAFSPDGKAVAIGSPSGVHLWDITTGRPAGKPLAAGLGPVGAVAFSPDGKTLAISNGGVVISNGRVVTYSPSDGGAISLWNIAAGRQMSEVLPVTAVGFAPGQSPMVFSPDGKTLAISNRDAVTLWDVATGQQIGEPLGGASASGGVIMAFSPDGRTLATSEGRGITLWDVATGQQIGNPLAGTAHLQTTAMALSPDGRTLATGGRFGVRLWDMATGQQIGSPLGNDAYDLISSMAFSPDGKTLATSGQSGARLWDVSYLTGTLPRVCAQAGGSLTPAQWARYVPPGTPYRNACSRAGTR